MQTWKDSDVSNVQIKYKKVNYENRSTDFFDGLLSTNHTTSLFLPGKDNGNALKCIHLRQNAI